MENNIDDYKKAVLWLKTLKNALYRVYKMWDEEPRLADIFDNGSRDYDSFSVLADSLDDWANGRIDEFEQEIIITNVMNAIYESEKELEDGFKQNKDLFLYSIDKAKQIYANGGKND